MSSTSQTLGQSISFPFSGKQAPNRFLKSAMTERLCVYDQDDFDNRGCPTEEYLHLYEQWGRGQIGTIVIGNTPVDKYNLEAAGNLIIDETLKWDLPSNLKKIIDVSRAHGSIVICQLTHAGRQCPSFINKHPVSSSETQCPPSMGMTFEPARALKVEEIKELVQKFGFAAEQLHKAGADGVQLHAAHGYLLSQFLSPVVNKRTDQYGGSFDNRSRIIFEITDEIRRRVPDKQFMLSIKYNSQDFIEGGFSPEESRLMAERLEAAGFDLIELSGGTYESMAFEHKKESTKKREGFFIEFAEQMRPHIKKSVLCVTGGFRSGEAMAEAISGGTMDLVGLARPLCSEPDLPVKILDGKSHGAKDNLVEASKQTPAAILQLHQVAEKRPVTDYSDKENVAEVEKILTGEKPGLQEAMSGYSKDKSTKRVSSVAQGYQQDD